MIENPERYALPFIDAGADCLTIHPEAKGDVDEVLRICKERCVDFGLALKPNTPLDKYKVYYPECEILLIMSIEPGFGGQAFMPVAVERIRQAKQMREEMGARYKISVDGGINPETGAACAAAGANILVAGSAVFLSDDSAALVLQLKGEMNL